MTTIADVVTPAVLREDRVARGVLDVLLVLAGSVVVALSAQIQLTLPFTPVPVTGQPFAVLLVGAALGSRRGVLAMAAYLIEGASGLPVFAGGGCCAARLLGPTAGYLWSYPLAAGTVGFLAERGWDRRPGTTALAMLAGSGVIYLVGLPWLAVFVGWDQVLFAGLLPFLPGDLVKVVAATAVLPLVWKLLGRSDRWSDRGAG